MKIGSWIYKKSIKIFRGKGLRRYKTINSINKKIQDSLRTDFIEIEGNKMYLGDEDYHNISLGIFEPEETKLVKRQIKTGQTVVDIGASIGYYTLIFAKLVGESGYVYSFEPSLNKFKILQQNIQLNNLTNINVEKKIVSNIDGEIELFGERSESISLNEYFKDKKIDFIKIDVDGMEKKIVDGMIHVLENNMPIKLMMEYYPPGLEQFSGRPTEFPAILEKMGFEIFDINQKMKKITTDELETLYPNSQNEYTNLFFSRI